MAKLFLFELISKPIKKYILAILSSTKKKNCSAMSKEINISKKQLIENLTTYRFGEGFTGAF